MPSAPDSGAATTGSASAVASNDAVQAALNQQGATARRGNGPSGVTSRVSF